jgi:hypothetical protein
MKSSSLLCRRTSSLIQENGYRRVASWLSAPGLVITLLLFYSCNTTDCCVEQVDPATKPCRTLLVIGDDRSGSADEVRDLTEADYQRMIEAVNKLGGGTVATLIIGNAIPPDMESMRLDLRSPSPLFLVPERECCKLEYINKLTDQNKSITASNKKMREQNTGKSQEYLSTLRDKVIGYRPDKVDLTDIDDALRRVNLIVNEPAYRDFEHVVVALFSDGINQPRSNRIEPVRNKLEPARSIQLWLVGWRDPSVFSGISGVQQFEGKQGLMAQLEKLSCNTKTP